jgi:signal transduction histidine kinase
MNFLVIPSLRWRLVAVMVLADMIVAITTGIVTYTSQRGGLHDQLVTRAKDGASILAAGAAPTLLASASNRTQLLQNLVSDLPGTGGISYAAVFGPTGCVIASTDGTQVRRHFCMPLKDLNGQHDLKNGNIEAVAAVVPGDQPIGFATVTASSSSADSDLAQSTIESAGVHAIGVLIFFLLSLAIAQYLIGPLEELARVARSIAGGDLTSRAPEERTGELTALAEAFNNMASSLEQRIRQLSFLATAGSTLPNTFRNGADVSPIIAQFCDQLGACAAGLILRNGGEAEPLWYETETAGPDCASLALRIARSARVADAYIEAEHSVMVVPVMGNAAFVAVRDTASPFPRAEQQVIINFAYQLSIASDNAQLFESQQEALQVKDQFLSIVSHELRTPLTSIKGYAQMLHRRLEADETDARYAASIDAQVTRLTRLVDDLLDVTRFARGQFELTLAPTDLRPILEEVVARFRMVAPRHTFRVDMDGGTFSGEWDHDRLEQVLNNLLSNAVKYSPDGGEVVLCAHRLDKAVVITVKDQGMGIDEEHQQHLFERFYRAGADASDIKGLGLGLYVTWRIIEAHHGTIAVESVVNQGTEFTVTLPIAPVPAGVNA